MMWALRREMWQPRGVWLVAERLYLGDYRSGERALAGSEKPVAPDGVPAPFAGIVSLCPMPLLSDETIDGPARATTEWLAVPILDGGRGEGELESALGLIVPFVRRRRVTGNVLVHCAAGMSRSVAVMAALLCEDGMTLEAALRRIIEAKATALYPFVGEESSLIALAGEFTGCLNRLYGRPSNPAEGC
ncbi:MAG: dual specificity protein phosphatase family protein [Polyangiaceae bacterium]|nr:dual specificity protein phosphatase family protein [Polyangiaceae bacterium]